MPEFSITDTTDVARAPDVRHPDRDDLRRRLAAGRCPSGDGVDHRMPLAASPALAEHLVQP